MPGSIDLLKLFIQDLRKLGYPEPSRGSFDLKASKYVTYFPRILNGSTEKRVEKSFKENITQLCPNASNSINETNTYKLHQDVLRGTNIFRDSLLIIAFNYVQCLLSNLPYTELMY